MLWRTSPVNNKRQHANMGTVLLLLMCFGYVSTFKPVIIVHGILDGPKQMSFLKSSIEKIHNGTNVTIIALYDGVSSLVHPLWEQVAKYEQAIMPIANASLNGFHLICYSQGGLLCRGLLSSINNLNVRNVIFLSSPQMGQYGDTDYFRYLFPGYLKENLYKILYTKFGQRFALGNYWNDPHHHQLYTKYSAYLAIINNQTAHNDSHRFKRNFLKIRNLVCIGGPDDGVIQPWQSSHFAFYNGSESVVEYKHQSVYTADSFGLRTLDARGSFHINVVPGVEHIKWHVNMTVIRQFIIPWLD